MKTHNPRGQRPRQAEIPDYQSDDDLLDNLQHGSWYDSLSLQGFTPWAPSVRLFGNANIGMLDYTNLQVSGMLMPGNHAEVLTGWRARTNIPHAQYPEIAQWWRLLLEHTHVTLVVGNRPRWHALLSDLFRLADEPERLKVSWPLPIPPRQNVHVQLELFSSGTLAPQDFLPTLNSEYQPWSGMNPQIWIHLDGLILFQDDWDEMDEEAHRRWRKLSGRIARLLVRHEKHVDDTATLVARWLGAQLPDNVDSETRAQFEALADGIRERRFEGGSNAMQFEKSRLLEQLGPLVNVQEGIAYLDLPAGDMAPVSPTDRARIRVNLTTNNLEVSINGAAYRRVMLAGEP
ncbi:MAG TPA: hypothetical protein VF488_04945 [Gemmatimonadaceae bacterium]